MSQATRNALILMSAGLFAGFLSGMFGIGGGTVIVPALMAVGFSQRSGLGFKSSCDCSYCCLELSPIVVVGAHCLGSGIANDDWNAPWRAGRNVAARSYA